MVKSYLDKVEEGHIDVWCGELSRCRLMDERNIFCAVHIWYCSPNENSNKKGQNFKEELLHTGCLFTHYFSSVKAFVAIDQYRSRDIEKYSLKQLMPKGILLGAIPYYSGNQLFRGILDGHPDVLEVLPFSPWDNNLFLYCIRLSDEKAENILAILKEMLEDEIGEISAIFPNWNRFAESAEALLMQKDRFTSQELFLLFRIAYAEMMRGERIVDISRKIIYWEPHHFPRTEIPLLAKWLESEQICGHIIVICRNQLMRTGSRARSNRNNTGADIIFPEWMIPEEWMIEENIFPFQHWRVFKMRFEDLKLHPEVELPKICDRLGIVWSDTMLRTTFMGETQNYWGVQDFDLRPVFHRYEEYLSQFDRFRISILSAPYQKKFGYPYVDCRMFSRRELWEMFRKEFRFQCQLRYADEREKRSYNISMHRKFRWQLWRVRAYTITGNIIPEFGAVEMGVSAPERQPIPLVPQAMNVSRQNEKREKADNILAFARSQEKLILYGIGKDCSGLLERLTIAEQEKFKFCDRKAAQGECMFRGQRVLAPRELCDTYQEYNILITSSMYSTWIRWELEDLGVNPERITCNTVQLWEDA